MALLSTSNLDEQRQILAELDAFTSALEKFPDGECMEVGGELKIFAYLLEILKKLGVTEDEIIEWLVSFIKNYLPLIELGVKGILLANLRNLISCSVDPRIPAWARDINSGLTFDLSQIDAKGMLNCSPLDETENQMYFGVTSAITNEEGETENITLDSPYEFLRHKDFNTFLWYIIHKGKYPTPSILDGTSNYSPTFGDVFNGNVTQRNYSKRANNIFDVTELNYSGSDTAGIVVGNSFKELLYGSDYYANSLSVCVKTERNKENNVAYNCLFPVGAYWDRTTYYVNRPTYFNFLTPDGSADETNPRNFNKDVALCSFKYFGDMDDMTDEMKSNLPKEEMTYLRDKIQLVILPKPLIHIPHIGQSILFPVKILFDNEGKPSSKGKFSVITEEPVSFNEYVDSQKERFQEKLDSIFAEEKIEGYDIDDPDKGKVKSGRWGYKIKNPTNGREEFFIVIDSTGEYWVSESRHGNPIPESGPTHQKFLSYLQECYTNLTLFEFNYDYIMSMRLFDAKVIVTQLINGILNMNFGFRLGVSINEIAGTDRLINIIKQMVDAEDYTSSDCFFTFSNAEYDQMSWNAEMKRANLTPFGDSTVVNTTFASEITDMLNEFGDEPSLKKNVDTFKRMMNKVSATIVNEGSDPYDTTSFNVNGKSYDSVAGAMRGMMSDLITQFITELTTIIVDALLSPKFLLVILVNRELCGQNTKNFSIEQIIRDMIGMVMKIIQEIKDMIVRALFEFIMRYLMKLLALLSAKLLLEQAENYRKLIKKMLKECTWLFGHRPNIPTVLDRVDYADIDDPKEQPESDKC